MRNFVIVFTFALFAYSKAEEAYFKLGNDPDYPQHVVITDVEYKIVPNEHVDINCTLTIYEELDESTNVSKLYDFIVNPIFHLRNDLI